MARRFLVTAGNTRELIDEVRDWGNIFTGRTGLDIARALLDLGDVTLLTSNREHQRDFAGLGGRAGQLEIQTFDRHGELVELLEKALKRLAPDGVVMSAAVCDYAPAGAFEVVHQEVVPGTNPPEYRWTVRQVHRGKVPGSFPQVAFLGRPTAKIIDMFREVWGYSGLLWKFKLEVGLSDGELLDVAGRSRLASGADYIVANTLEMVRGPEPGAYILGENFSQRIDRKSLATRIAELTRGRLNA